MRTEKDYNALLVPLQPPQDMWGATLQMPEAQQTRDVFFKNIRRSFEAEFSYSALEMALSVTRVVSPPLKGDDVDMSDELTLISTERPAPIAFALQTREHNEPVVRFGLVPIHKFGNKALSALKEADEAFSDIVFRG